MFVYMHLNFGLSFMWQGLARQEGGREVQMWFYMFLMTGVHTGSPGKSTPLSSYFWKALVEKAAGPVGRICRWDIKKDYNTLLLPPHMGLTGTIAWEYHSLTNWGFYWIHPLVPGLLIEKPSRQNLVGIQGEGNLDTEVLIVMEDSESSELTDKPQWNWGPNQDPHTVFLETFKRGD